MEAVAAVRAAEVIVVTLTHSQAARERSHELIAEAFGCGCGERIAQPA